ncbi:MAG: hypothetical protein Tsb0013_00300 [Phycisphaerales bacterium]
MPAPIEPHEISWKTPGVRGYGALLLIAIGLFITLRMLIPTIQAASVSDEVEQAEAFDVAQQRADHERDMQTWVNVVDGRSPFFIPPAPIIEQEVVVEQEDNDDTDDRPVVPRTYGGPKVIAAMNGRIWLDNETTVALGEEGSGVTLISLDNVPWTVRVGWRGAEFDVDIFKNTTPRFLSRDRDGE